MLKFDLLESDPASADGSYLGSHARRGRLTLNHGVVETPIFMPVGTYGTVKGVMPRSLHEMGAQIILGNTFHLWMRPGLDVIEKFGGLHAFEKWDKPILTDSGGFQVWSLGAMRKISEEGVRFSSPVNGDKLFLTPEVSMQIQTTLNSDIVMQFDECTPYLSVEPKTKGQIRREASSKSRGAERTQLAIVRSVFSNMVRHSFWSKSAPGAVYAGPGATNSRAYFSRLAIAASAALATSEEVF
jgi:queuine tRNA-ribosyltransferase